MCAFTITFACLPITANWDVEKLATAKCFSGDTFTALGLTNSGMHASSIQQFGPSLTASFSLQHVDRCNSRFTANSNDHGSSAEHSRKDRTDSHFGVGLCVSSHTRVVRLLLILHIVPLLVALSRLTISWSSRRNPIIACTLCFHSHVRSDVR